MRALCTPSKDRYYAAKISRKTAYDAASKAASRAAFSSRGVDELKSLASSRSYDEGLKAIKAMKCFNFSRYR